MKYIKELQNFKKRFSPSIIKKSFGVELLKLIAYPKYPDSNIKEQFKNLYEENYVSLKNELENGMVDFGSGSAGYDINFVLAYRKGNWYNKKNKVTFEDAIQIAEQIKQELVRACEFLENDDFKSFYDFVSNSRSGLFNKGYTHKYFYILYPKYITFYHASTWQQYYKKCLELPKTQNKNYYDIEKYFIDNDANCHVGEKSKELEEKYGTPKEFKTTEPQQNLNNKSQHIFPLNQILYGPPGTGKTYNTVIKAMEIINPSCIMRDENGYVKNYSEVKKEFDNAKFNHQIEFVTFHQSYSYEEFVEGIKPELQSEDNLKYVLENGIFKEICKNATKKITDNFEDVYNNFINEVSKVDEDDFYKLYTLKNHKIFGLQVNGNNNLNIHMTDNFNKQGVITKENLKKHFENMRGARDWANYYDAIIEHLKNNYNLVLENTDLKPHVLIIDEINRGNISKIFGELITLIEDDKRENLSVKLPYSQESFTVPKNLYIIGTMNTSDRSIASIDIALRRRFKFKEMMPQKDLVADFGIRFADIFEDLNTKIKILLDRDHQIGHSYFIKTKYENAGIDELKTIWFSEILPLLNEYFYCDWEKLKLIVPGFIKKLEVPEVLKNECDDSIYEFKTLDEIKDFEKALNQEKFE